MSSADASDLTTPPHDSFLSSLATAPIWRTGLVAGVVAAVAATVVAAVAKAMDVPMEAPAFGGDTPEDIPIPAFALNVLWWTAVGTVLAYILARRSQQPARLFVIITVVLTVLSLVSPLVAKDTTTATQVTLMLTHLVAAAIVIPALAWRLEQPDTSGSDTSGSSADD